MDIFLDDSPEEPALNVSPNIEFQLDKYNINEYFIKKNIPELALFIPTLFISKLKQFYANNIDIPLLIYGVKGCGKLTAILGLMNNVPAYATEYATEYALDTVNSVIDGNDGNDSNDNINNMKINNIYYMKILDKEYDKLLVYENLYYVNIEILISPSEILLYLKHLYKLSRGRSIDCSKKIIIISHIDKCNIDALKYINYMLEKINCYTSYIFTITKQNNITNKITSSCARLNFGYLNKDEFNKIFTYNYKHIFHKQYLTPEYITQYYNIYINNQYNIGNTISQIKYLIFAQNITIEKLKLHENKDIIQSLMYNIVKSFIKNHIKLDTVNNAEKIRHDLYILLSLNIDLIYFVKILIKQILHNNKITNATRELIITSAGELSHQLHKNNKEVINVEKFIYNLIYIFFSSGITINNIL